MNQRAGRYHAASSNDDGGGNITLSQLIKFVRAAQVALENTPDEIDSAVRFEIFADYLEEDVANGAPFVFSTKTLGL